LGIKAFVEGMKTAYAWDIATRTGALPDAGGKIEVHEFDFKSENGVIYEENGVTIRSWPAIHSLDGSVSYSLEWSGLKYVFGGDTYPNKWYIKHATNADVASHEAFLPPKALAKYFGWDLGQATYVATRILTKEDIVVRMATVDDYVLPSDVTTAYKKAPRTAQKSPSDWTVAGKWKGYTPPPMPKK
jgi:ribonuclease Z